MAFRFWKFCIALFATLLAQSPLAASAYTIPIQKAVAYLNARGEKLSFDALISLELLKRNYNVPLEFSAAKNRLLKKTPPRYRPLLRIVNNEIKLSHLEVSAIRGGAGILVEALHCDVYPLPWDYYARVRKAVTRDRRSAHAAILALSFIEWLNCEPDHDRIKKFRTEYSKIVFESILHETPGSFYWFEYILALIFSNHIDFVEEYYANIIMSRQLKDGSWDNNDIKTAKALSILVFLEEKKNPNMRRERRYKIFPSVPSTSS